MNKFAFAAIIAAGLSVSQANAGIVNGSFESGGTASLSGWSSFGPASSSSASSTNGSFSAIEVAQNGGATNAAGLESFLGVTDAALKSIKSGLQNFTTGSAIKQTFTASAGDKISFDWRFLTNEYIPSPWDFAFYVLNGTAVAIGDTNINSGYGAGIGGYSSATAWNTTTVTIATAGTYTLGFGALQGGDNMVESALLVDNVKSTPKVPEPASLGLLGLGMTALFGARRRKTA